MDSGVGSMLNQNPLCSIGRQNKSTDLFPKDLIRMTTLPLTQGTYTLVIELERPTDIRVGALGVVIFDKGLYTYTGSALGKSQSLRTRLLRHIRDTKTMRWHIDYFLQGGKIRSIVLCESTARLECPINQALGSMTKGTVIAKRFGASDCHMGCPAHLYHQPEHGLNRLVKEILNVYHSYSGNVRCYMFT